MLDPYVGSGTTLMVALRMGADGIGCDGSADYLRIAVERINSDWVPVSERKKPSGKKRRKRIKGERFLF